MTVLLIFTAAFSLLLALLHPVTLILSRFSRRAGRGFYTVETTHKGKHWRTMHLTSYDPVGRLSRMQALHFHQCFLAALENALRGFREPLYFRSHLMRPVHLRSMENCLAAFPERRWRKKRVRISRAEHWGIRLQTLFNEWRWITPQNRGYLIVIGPPRTRGKSKPKSDSERIHERIRSDRSK